LRSTERRPLLTSVRRAITRVALRADLVLAINLSFAAGGSGGSPPKRLGFTRSCDGGLNAGKAEAYRYALRARQRLQEHLTRRVWL
jgi:hypothetical protein